MKKMMLILVGALACAVTAATSTPKGFTDNLDEALANAKKSGKYVYACFSGSDWCCWCQYLEKEVFSDASYDFTGSLKDDYLFVFIDSPRNKDVLSERAKTENPKLMKKYDIHGFPTALILDGEGKTIEKTGYRRGGAKAYASYLKLFRKYGKNYKELQKKVEQKYFGEMEKKFNAALEPLQNKPGLAEFKAAKPKFVALEKEIAAVKIDAADADLGEIIRAQYVGTCQRFVKLLDRDIARREKAAKDAPAKDKKADAKKPAAKK